jgi:hypothetical protein
VITSDYGDIMTNNNDIKIIEKLNKIISKANWSIVEACLESYKIGRFDKFSLEMMHKQFCNAMYGKRVSKHKRME